MYLKYNPEYFYIIIKVNITAVRAIVDSLQTCTVYDADLRKKINIVKKIIWYLPF